MALLTPPSAQDVYNEAGHNNAEGLTAAHLGRSSDSDVLLLIDTEILPTVTRTINGQADEAAYPFDFPLSVEVWQSARKTFMTPQINEEIANQQGGFQDAIRQEAASRLLRRVVTTNEFWQTRAEQLHAASEESLTAAKLAVGSVVKRTLDAQAEGRAGFALLSIDTEPRPFGSEFGFTTYGEF